jgi:hypothetical protein
MRKKDVVTIILLVVVGALIAISFITDKPTASLTFFTLVLASITIWTSIDSAEESRKQTEQALEMTRNTAIETKKQTERSLKLTEITLEKAVLEKKIEDLKECLDLFYYPLRDYLIRGPTLTQCWQPEIFDKIGFHRYLATKEIIKQFEDFQKGSYSHGSDPCNLLTISVNKEVELLENEYRDLKERFISLEKEYQKLKNIQ